LKVNDDRRNRIQDPDPNPDLDPLVRGMDPRILIRIHPNMSCHGSETLQERKFLMRVKHPRYANYHKIDKFMYVSGFSDGESRVRPVFSKQKTTIRSKKTEAGDGGGGG
jgi:hypothetical protein